MGSTYQSILRNDKPTCLHIRCPDPSRMALPSRPRTSKLSPPQLTSKSRPTGQVFSQRPSPTPTWMTCCPPCHLVTLAPPPLLVQLKLATLPPPRRRRRRPPPARTLVVAVVCSRRTIKQWI